MKTKIIPASLSFMMLLTSCAGQAPRKDLDSKRKIQAIALTGRSHVYAQDNIVLTRSSVDRELSNMNALWKDELSTANAYRASGIATFISEIATLAICVGQNNVANVIGWCSGSIAMGVATYMLMNRADDYRFRAIDQYNHSSQAGVVPQLEQESARR